MRYHRTTAAAGERAHVVQGSLILDRYRPLGEAGSGGFGAVQVAWDPRIQRKVAIKIIELTEVDALRAALPGADAVSAAPAAQPVPAASVPGSPAPAAQPVPGSPAPAALRFGVAAEQPAPAAQQTIAAPQPAPAAQQASEAQRSKTDSVAIDARERWHGVLPWDDVLAEEGDALPEGLPRKTLNWEDDGFEPDGTDFGTAAEAEGFEQVRALSRIPGIDEARTAALLSDPRIVTVYDVEVRDCCAYLIMEYVEGVTLTRLLYDYDDLLTLDMVTAVFDAVSKALQVAHARGVLHLDIKPDNILVNREGQVKVTDFGLATLADASGRGTTGGGTIGYMPLEQMRKQELDARCDEWALASVTYEMLAGENPFLAADLQAAEAAIENAELVIPSLCWEDLDEGIDDAIFYALDPDREQRYASVRDFAEEAEAFLGDAQRGTRQLSLLVKDALGDGEAADGKLADELETEGGEQESWLCGSEGRAVERTPRIPLRDRVTPRMKSGAARAVGAVGSGLLMLAAVTNMPLAAAGGLLAAPIAAGLAALVGAIRPHVGALAAFVAFAGALAAGSAPSLGAVLLVATVAWWYVFARGGNAAANVALAMPATGSIGLACAAPLAAGAVLPPVKALATSAFAMAWALAFASLGPGSLAGWSAPSIVSFVSVDIQGNALDLLTRPATWCIALSWIAGAGLQSLCSLRGTRTARLLGVAVGSVVLIAGVVVAAWFASGRTSWIPEALPLLSVVVSAALVAFFAGEFSPRSQ